MMPNNPPFLRTFFNYYGGKWRIAPKYPAPQYDTIIEPFCGAAGYSLRHYKKNVVLVDSDPCIAGIWRWLIGASYEDVMALPVIGEFDSVDQIDAPQGAKDLIGFCVNAGASSPCNTPSKWAREYAHLAQFWNAARRLRVAQQVEHIKHWSIWNGPYHHIFNRQATWFIDPPYDSKAGTFYRNGRDGIDYKDLAGWCRSRDGQVIVCENEGANWLPFKPFIRSVATSKNGARFSREAIWTNDDA